MNNFAFIDSQNLNLAIQAQGWRLDFRRFRMYLKEKYKIQEAFLFIGYCKENQKLYHYLRNSDYRLIFKPIIKLPNQKIKGNVDAELVLHAMIEYDNYDRAIIVSNDGDFHCLINYLKHKNKLFKLLIPNRINYSTLLRPFGTYMIFMNDLKEKLEYKQRGGINLRTKP